MLFFVIGQKWGWVELHLDLVKQVHPTWQLYIGRVAQGSGNNMAQYRPIYPSLPTHGPSPSLSAVRSSQLSPLSSFPVMVSLLSLSPFSELSQTLSLVSQHSSLCNLTQVTSPPSPDFLNSFEHTAEMEDGVCMVEDEGKVQHQENLPPLFLCDSAPVWNDVTLSPAHVHEGRTWVVFYGKILGLYAHL